MKDVKNNNRIQEIVYGAVDNIKSLIDVDVVIGKPIEAGLNLTIIPLTKVTMGFVSGGGEYYSELREIKKDGDYPYAGGLGSGMNIQPVGFLIINENKVEVVKIDAKSAVEKLIELAPEVAKYVSKFFDKKEDNNCKN